MSSIHPCHLPTKTCKCKKSSQAPPLLPCSKCGKTGWMTVRHYWPLPLGTVNPPMHSVVVSNRTLLSSSCVSFICTWSHELKITLPPSATKFFSKSSTVSRFMKRIFIVIPWRKSFCREIVLPTSWRMRISSWRERVRHRSSSDMIVSLRKLARTQSLMFCWHCSLFISTASRRTDNVKWSFTHRDVLNHSKHSSYHLSNPIAPPPPPTPPPPPPPSPSAPMHKVFRSSF